MSNTTPNVTISITITNGKGDTLTYFPLNEYFEHRVRATNVCSTLHFPPAPGEMTEEEAIGASLYDDEAYGQDLYQREVTKDMRQLIIDLAAQEFEMNEDNVVSLVNMAILAEDGLFA